MRVQNTAPEVPDSAASGNKQSKQLAVRADRPGAAAPVPAQANEAAPKPAAPPTAPAGAGAGSTAWIDQLPPEAQERVKRVLQSIGPEAAAKVNKMSADERRAFFQQLRAQREQQQSQ